VGNTANILLLTGLIATAPVGAEFLFYHNFDNETLHTYTREDPVATWGARDAIVVQPNAVKIVKDPDVSGTHGKVMQVFYAGKQFGYSGNSGAQWLKKLDSRDELYCAFDVYFESDAEFVKGGKLPGSPRSTGWLTNQKGKRGKIKPDGTDYWSAGAVWSFDGELKAYVYHANQSRVWGDTIHWHDGADGENTYFTPGKWHRIEIRVKINTPGVLDGRMQGWFDGELRLDRSDLMFRMPGGEHLRIGQYFAVTFFGGGDSSFAPSEDQHVYFDNFVVSTQPITHK